MAKVTIRAWTHPQDDQILPGSWVMAELHDARPRPVGLFIKILGEHHYSTRNKLQNVTCRQFFIHNHMNFFFEYTKKNTTKQKKVTRLIFYNQIKFFTIDGKKYTILQTKKNLRYFYALKVNEKKKNTAENENYFLDFHTQTLAQCQQKKNYLSNDCMRYVFFEYIKYKVNKNPFNISLYFLLM